MASWITKQVHRYEQMRFDQEPRRRTLSFVWGLEHIGGAGNGESPRAFLDRYVGDAVARSDDWYSVSPAHDYAVTDNVLTFTSAIASPWPENNRVHAQLFPARNKRAAVVVLAQWNARWEEQQNVCRWLQRLGVTAIKMSLPYHDRRSIPGHPRADHLVGPNIGLTMQAARQAVLDARRTLRWLEGQGYERLGVLGTSIGSAIGFITMCHDPAVRAGAFVHASTYFGEVVSHGMTTTNVWEPLSAEVTREELIRFWLPISPFPYIPKLTGAGKKILLITGRYDPTFWPEFTNQLLGKLRAERVAFENLSLPCGHYSMGVWPFSNIAGYRFGRFLQSALAK
ncbi:MAG TPA: abhydrolase domain-containing 18 [Verrucomicrobiae bacterium]|nr:abhydrolase domain-containing 18 [Verrucomicrobiae bacterium]